MSEQSILIVLGVLGFVLNIVVLSVGGVMALARSTAAINKTITDHRTEIDGEFVIIRKETGELGAALRQKLTDIELWSRDNFVRRDSFASTMERVERNIKDMGDRIETRLLRMEGKIDSAVPTGHNAA